MIYLSLTFVILIGLVGGQRGLKSLFTLVLNVLVLSTMLTLISWSFHPILITLLTSLIISNIILFYQNGKNAKTLASFLAMILVVALIFIITLFISLNAKLGGFNHFNQPELISFGMPGHMNINMHHIAIAMFITGMMGACLDTSISIASGVYEVFRHHPETSKRNLYQSGMRMGSQILSTTINTLFFAYIGGGMSLMILFKMFDYKLLDMINSKAFLQEALYISIASMACVLVIPITAWLVAHILTHPKKWIKHMEDDELFNTSDT